MSTQKSKLYYKINSDVKALTNNYKYSNYITNIIYNYLHEQRGYFKDNSYIIDDYPDSKTPYFCLKIKDDLCNNLIIQIIIFEKQQNYTYNIKYEAETLDKEYDSEEK